MALRGVECVPCRAAGHRCPAVANDGEAKCLDCMNEQPCAAVRCAGQVREESSVLARVGLFGEIEPTGVNTEVRQRTPEELGLARVVPDVPQRKEINVWPDWTGPEDLRAIRGRERRRWGGVKRADQQSKGVYRNSTAQSLTQGKEQDLVRRAARRTNTPRLQRRIDKMVEMRRGGAKQEEIAQAYGITKSRVNQILQREYQEKPELRVIGGEPVSMPAGATMGAELIGGFIEEWGEVEVMPTGYVIDDATKAYIAADAATMTVNELCAKYKLCEPAIRRALKKHGVQARPGSRGRSRLLPRKASGAQLVHVDPKANGSAASLLGALDRMGSTHQPEKRFALQFTSAELVKVIAGLSEEQEARFVEAGLRAALLR